MTTERTDLTPLKHKRAATKLRRLAELNDMANAPEGAFRLRVIKLLREIIEET